MNKRHAVSTVEYMALLVAVLVALFLGRFYIIRAFAGMWKKAGDTFSYGQQYDPRPFGAEGRGGGTLRCYYAPQIGNWVDRQQAMMYCDCTVPKELTTEYQTRCISCLLAARNPMCTVE